VTRDSAVPQITFLGATGTVTGSKYLLHAAGRAMLVDCGLFQGLKPLRLRNWEPLAVRPDAVHGVVLTHAHLDHSGYLPLFVRNGFAGEVHCSAGTRDLCEILLPDSGHLQEEEARYANKRGFSKHKPALALYTEADARTSLKRLRPAAFHHGTEPVPGFRLELHPAGHIVGASIAAVETGGIRVVFSGDLGRLDDPIMRPPAMVEHADYLVIESTYGNRRHAPGSTERELAEHINRAIARRGVVIIPAFAVGRAQALLYFLSRLKANGAIADVPVYLNSPMAVNATRLYCDYRAEHRLTPAQCEAACAVAQVVNSADESRALNGRAGPMIIISASGMATGGRVVHHLKAFAPDARNMILLPGFQAAGTRGAALAAGAEAVKIHGEFVPVRAEVVKMDNLSAHADYAEILEWLRGFRHPPRHTFVTHGEPAAADELRRRIVETFGWTVTVPEYLDKVQLA
jgi:metallo-beta-lactamase family protein